MVSLERVGPHLTQAGHLSPNKGGFAMAVDQYRINVRVTARPEPVSGLAG
jgi:hypothetical protein